MQKSKIARLTMKRFEGDRSDLVLGKFNGALEFIVENPVY